MALANYTDLQASIASWLHRSDMTAIIPDLIALAEKRINGDLDARLQDTVASIVTVAGTQTVTAPSDVVNVRSLVVMSSPNQVLSYMTPDQFNVQYAAATSATPRSFTVVGANILLGPIPDAVYTLQCTYKAQVAPIASAQGGVNWLMTNYPQVYLMGSLCESVKFTKAFGSLAVWEQAYKEAINSVNSIDWYSGSTMRVRGDVRL